MHRGGGWNEQRTGSHTFPRCLTGKVCLQKGTIEMKVTYCGINRRKGVSQKTGNDYDISDLVYLIPFKGKRTDSYNYQGHGHEVKTLSADPACLDDFAAIKLGQEIDVALEPKPENPQHNWVVGLA